MSHVFQFQIPENCYTYINKNKISRTKPIQLSCFEARKFYILFCKEKIIDYNVLLLPFSESSSIISNIHAAFQKHSLFFPPGLCSRERNVRKKNSKQSIHMNVTPAALPPQIYIYIYSYSNKISFFPFFISHFRLFAWCQKDFGKITYTASQPHDHFSCFRLGTQFVKHASSYQQINTSTM